MNGKFHLIDMGKWERAPHFDYYYNKIKCRYNINADIDIGALGEFKKRRRLKFFPTMLYAVMRAVNMNKEFRMAFDENGNLGFWSEVVPCYTVFHKENHTFSDIWSEYDENFGVFYSTVLGDIEKYGKIAGTIKARPGQPKNFCTVSNLPWLSFTSFSQDTYTESAFLFPLIKFGKYFERDGKTLLPFSLFVSHAAADGYHACKLVNDIQEICRNPEGWSGAETE